MRTGANSSSKSSWLPTINSRSYHLLLAAVALLVLGPLGGIAAAYMNFSLGFFIGGQVLAGILGSTVTFGYGPEGKHGANYIQTMAASVAGMSGMAVLVQAMVWLGLPEPPAWQLVLYLTCIGMFGVGVGMLYTPILVDRMQLVYPSGFAVANILRALTDKNLLRRSVKRLGFGGLGGYVAGLAAMKVELLGGLGVSSGAIQSFQQLGFSSANLGAGMVVGARIAVPALIVGVAGVMLTPWLRTIGWLGAEDPWRKIGFILALGTILGAALVDLTLIGYQAVQRYRERSQQPVAEAPDWKRVNVMLLVLWVIGWGIGLTLVGSVVLHQPIGFVLLAISLVFVFMIINGISQGISDSNPISSAFVIAVFVMALAGLKDAGVGLMCAAILLTACSVGVDMQQDRSTGWRLGTNRRIQFRYQVIGIVMGAILAVALAKAFMSAYPVLKVDQFGGPKVPGLEQWQSAMTYKFVGALRELTNPKPHVMQALAIGIGIGFVTEVLRKVILKHRRYKAFVASGRIGYVTDFVLDTIILPSPYASSFGGFVDLMTSVWFASGGIISSLIESVNEQRKKGMKAVGEGEISSDMSTSSLVGGGLIAGDSLSALTIGLWGLLKTLTGH